MTNDLTKGNITKAIIAFSIPMIMGNFFQQLYNVVDSVLVGRFLGKNALAAVGSSFPVMVFFLSIVLGLCMGSSVVFSQYFGEKNYTSLKDSISTSFIFIAIITMMITALSIAFIDEIILFMNIPIEIQGIMKEYLFVIFVGIIFTFLYNWSASLLRSLGNSKIPLYCLIISALLNVALDILFMRYLKMGVMGAALATIISQLLSAILCIYYCIKNINFLNFKVKEIKFKKDIFKKTMSYSLLTSVQQSIMNFGILMVQGLVNSFGINTITAFTIVTKIDSFAYMPVQDFGNAFSTFVAQNKGAGKIDRINSGILCAMKFILIFCAVTSSVVIIFSSNLINLFISPEETEVMFIATKYLYIVATFYFGIGILFMLYGLYRGLGKVKVSIVLTITSLGLRVLLAYTLSSVPQFGLMGIWWSIPIGWIIADTLGLTYYIKLKGKNRL